MAQPDGRGRAAEVAPDDVRDDVGAGPRPTTQDQDGTGADLEGADVRDEVLVVGVELGEGVEE
ncbi:MAG: hypothetical protein ACRDY5_06505 [Acidimicrobiales bacterium]